MTIMMIKKQNERINKTILSENNLLQMNNLLQRLLEISPQNNKTIRDNNLQMRKMKQKTKEKLAIKTFPKLKVQEEELERWQRFLEMYP